MICEHGRLKRQCNECYLESEIKRLETALCAVLGLALEDGLDVLVDISIDALNSFELDAQYQKFVEGGMAYKYLK